MVWVFLPSDQVIEMTYEIRSEKKHIEKALLHYSGLWTSYSDSEAASQR